MPVNPVVRDDGWEIPGGALDVLIPLLPNRVPEALGALAAGTAVYLHGLRPPISSLATRSDNPGAIA